MADGLTIRVADEQVMSALDRLQGRLGDLTPVMNRIGAELESVVHIRFEAKRDPSGAPWAPLAASTRERYAKADRRPRAGGGVEVARRGTVLERYGTMRSSLSYRAGPSQVEVGFGVPYALYHEFGTRRMPRRGLLTADPESGTLGAEDIRDVLDILQGYLDSP